MSDEILIIRSSSLTEAHASWFVLDVSKRLSDDKKYSWEYAGEGSTDILLKFDKKNENLAADIHRFLSACSPEDYRREAERILRDACHEKNISFEAVNEKKVMDFKKTVIEKLEAEITRLNGVYNLKSKNIRDTIAQQRIQKIRETISSINAPECYRYDHITAKLETLKSDSKSTGKYLGKFSRYANHRFGFFKPAGADQIQKIIDAVKYQETRKTPSSPVFRK